VKKSAKDPREKREKNVVIVNLPLERGGDGGAVNSGCVTGLIRSCETALLQERNIVKG
jgi:hypothetical protein